MGKNKLRKENEALRKRIEAHEKLNKDLKEKFISKTLEEVNKKLSKIGYLEWSIDYNRGFCGELHSREITFKVLI